MNKIALVLMMILVSAGAFASAAQEDIAGAHDHPLVGRFQGSRIVRYNQKAFDEYRLITQKVTHLGGLAKNPGVAKRSKAR